MADQSTVTKEKTEGFSEAEKEAMRERARELKKGKKDGEADLLEKIAEMPEEDRVIAERIHQIVKSTAPELQPRTWYGTPAYAKDGKVLCFFQGAAKFGTRYATFGFNDVANLDEGSIWPVAFAIKKLTKAGEKEMAALVRKAVS
ncbi:MAG TPA: hypothetical protein VFO17_14245 [Acidimicrobiia bacterium]|nr:hypothetical protein [Acidimicrobiia bacterium]